MTDKLYDITVHLAVGVEPPSAVFKLQDCSGEIIKLLENNNGEDPYNILEGLVDAMPESPGIYCLDGIVMDLEGMDLLIDGKFIPVETFSSDTHQIVPNTALSWFHDNYPDAYEEFYDKL